MYIGGTGEAALHHLFAEVIDNAMDEAVAGHATFIDVRLEASGFLTVIDNGRGFPVDPHKKFPKKSALEVVMTMLHAGGKFDQKSYRTSGGLHGVGISVVNALSERLEVEVARGQMLYRQIFERGHPVTPLEKLGKVQNRRGSSVRFKPDERIFGKGANFKPERLFKMARAKAYLFGGVEIRWHCAPEWIDANAAIPAEAVFRFPGGLKDCLLQDIEGKDPLPTKFSRARLKNTAATDRSNGRWPGSPSTTASCIPIATPFPPPTAAPTKPAFAPRWRAA